MEISKAIKEARECRGLSIDEVAEKLKIRPKYLIAIEENQELPESLPSVYMVAYLKIYLEFLELDSEKIIQEIKNLKLAPSELFLPEHYDVQTLPSNFIIAISIILTIAIYCVYLNS